MAIQWNKNYTTYNNGQFETRQLNLFQRGLRVIGFYSNTRLARVATLAIDSFYKPESEYNESLINLAKKAQRLHKIRDSFGLESGQPNLKFRGVFESDGSSTFYIGLNADNHSRGAIVNMKPSEDRSILIKTLYESYPRNDSFINDENDLLAKAAYTFVAKLLSNSNQFEKVTIQGDGVGSEAIARQNGYQGMSRDDDDGLSLSQENIDMNVIENIHQISMNAFCPQHLVEDAVAKTNIKIKTYS